MPEVPQPPQQPQQPTPDSQPAAPQSPEGAKPTPQAAEQTPQIPSPEAQAELDGAQEVLGRENPAPDLTEAFETIAEGGRDATDANKASETSTEGTMPPDPFTPEETQQAVTNAEAALGLENETNTAPTETTQQAPENQTTEPTAEAVKPPEPTNEKPAEAASTPDPKAASRRETNDTARDSADGKPTDTTKGKADNEAQNKEPEGPQDPFSKDETDRIATEEATRRQQAEAIVERARAEGRTDGEIQQLLITIIEKPGYREPIYKILSAEHRSDAIQNLTRQADTEEDPTEKSKLMTILKIILGIVGLAGGMALETAKATVKQ